MLIETIKLCHHKMYYEITEAKIIDFSRGSVYEVTCTGLATAIIGNQPIND